MSLARRSRRSWKPNIVNKRFWSETYQRFLSFRVHTDVIKKVKKLAHGIDEYLMRTPNDPLLYRNALKKYVPSTRPSSAEMAKFGVTCWLDEALQIPPEHRDGVLGTLQVLAAVGSIEERLPRQSDRGHTSISRWKCYVEGGHARVGAGRGRHASRAP